MILHLAITLVLLWFVPRRWIFALGLVWNAGLPLVGVFEKPEMLGFAIGYCAIAAVIYSALGLAILWFRNRPSKREADIDATLAALRQKQAD